MAVRKTELSDQGFKQEPEPELSTFKVMKGVVGWGGRGKSMFGARACFHFNVTSIESPVNDLTCYKCQEDATLPLRETQEKCTAINHPWGNGSEAMWQAEEG